MLPVPCMAHQPSSVDQKLREVLRQIQSEGRAEELLQVIQSSFGPFDVQGMSDPTPSGTTPW